MIYTLTLNPALDYVLDIKGLEFGVTNRSGNQELSFGGKGINVSVILSRLGIPTTAFGLVAGFTGEYLKSSLEKEGIKTDFVSLCGGMTRINLKLREGGSITEINSQGPTVTGEDLENLFSKFKLIEKGDTLVLAGSIPKGMSKSIYSEIMQRLENKGIRFVVDTTGDSLIECLKYNPFLIKPNREELEQLFGNKIQTDQQIISAANKLKQMGAENVLVSLGEDGAILVDEQGNVYVSPSKKIVPKNTVGAGDSMVAGFLAGANKGYEYALSLGIAAGAATAASQTLATGEQILKLLDE